MSIYLLYLFDHLDNRRCLVWSEDGGVKVTIIVVILLSDLAMLLRPLLQDKSDLTEKLNHQGDQNKSTPVRQGDCSPQQRRTGLCPGPDPLHSVN